ncbi:LacI family DNA-binding transcriptional regulator [Microbacterium tumbae]
MGNVTLADVAKAAGVSTATVSRVLAGSRPVGADIADRVRAAADRLDYSSNGIARALRQQRTDTVGVVVPSILNPFFTSLVDSIEGALHDSGKQLILCDSRQDPELEDKHLRLLLERHVDGIVVSPCDSVGSVDAVARTAAVVPLVQLDRRVDVADTDWVGLDDERALGLVLEHVRDRGGRRVAFVTSRMTNSSTVDRLRGFRAGVELLGLEAAEDGIVLGEFSVDSGERAALSLLDRPADTRPDAIVCADDLLAIGVLRGCQELGVRVPDEVQVTGIDDIVFSRFVSPRLTTLAQPTAQMAQEVLRLLAQRAVAGRSQGPATRIALTPRLVERESTRRAS